MLPFAQSELGLNAFFFIFYFFAIGCDGFICLYPRRKPVATCGREASWLS